MHAIFPLNRAQHTMYIMALAACEHHTARPALQPEQRAVIIIEPSVSVIIHAFTSGMFIRCECQTLAAATYFPEITFPPTEAKNPDTTDYSLLDSHNS